MPGYAIDSDPGRVRERNEDFAAALPGLGIFAVADGMGGHAGGELASRLAVGTALAWLGRSARLDLDALARAVTEANRTVLGEAERRGLWGMGTTLTLCCTAAAEVRIAHVGDSRAYLLRDDRAELLTTDQTIVEQMVRQGALSRERARMHPERHVLAQALGTRDEIRPELLQVRAGQGSRLLLATDGLHDQISEKLLCELARAPERAEAARALVDAANQAGGLDNVTVLLVDL